MSSTNDILKAFRAAPKLCKETFPRWTNFILLVLQNFGLEHLVNQELPELLAPLPGPQETKEHSETINNINNDRSFRVALTSIIPQEYYHLIEHKKTARMMWDEQQDYFKPKTEGGAIAHLKAF